ncbi:Asp23/Gls24 family envelope stress response protein [Sporolactobacillus shoreicorticis]|uniref:Asp23/Gls24 family envelope stress response protein n=1 Tax=Sporolactobacillus shoreicorticis TaxID=1923877 RepID=A0ABW5S7F2_9BACL|nr:Asp23/Gls24 family envelope stress response protein [Sporolactobacillus shoreicorticis]MCO7126589.1 Asp23/Gls24 family envelope stress response protein [Sporolactobacillus shoreicorticis]
MPENENRSIEVEEQQEDLGRIEISPEVIEVIASLAAVEIVGVSDLHGNFASGMVEKLSGRNYRKGVKVDLTDDGIIIDVQLTMNYGVSIPDVAEKVQDNIVQTLKRMTALDVHEINIHVVGVRFDHKEKTDSEID